MPDRDQRMLELFRRLAIGWAVVSGLLSPAWAQEEEAASDADSGVVESARPAFQISPATSEIRIDAVLDEPAWADALRVELNYETQPSENTPPPVETEVWLTHDDKALYVAFRAHDEEPSNIRAHLSDRDRAFSDDFVGIVVDPFNDERRGFEFFVNPLGVQMDLFQDDVSGNESESWDAIWESAGRIDSAGFIVEFKVPFHQLRFPSGHERQTWGIDILRFYPREDRVRIASQPMDRGLNCYLCQISKIEGFEDITAGNGIELVPTVTGSRADTREDFPDGPLLDGSEDAEFGLTAKWGITPNLTLNGAINPDFSQVEADVAQLDVNRQFALFFPERRTFFLEGADFFRTPFQAVFTRNVADPSWGVKLSGKQGNNAFGVFVAQDELTNLIFPGSQRSEAESFDFETLDSVVRYRRDLGANSAVGVLVTDREGDDYFNRVVGVDGLIRFKESHTFRFQGLSSETEYPLEVAEEFDQPLEAFDDSAWQLRYSYDTRNWNAWARYEDIGEDFRADLGFMPQVGRSFVVGGLSHTWWGEDDDWFNRIGLNGDWDRTEDEDGNVLEEELELNLNLNLPKQTFWFVGGGVRDQFFDGKTFESQKFINSFFETRPTGDLSLEMFVGYGDAIDFANVRQAERLILEPEINYNFGLHLRASLSHEYVRLDVDEGELFTANLSQLRLVYQFNVRSFLRATLQYTDLTRDPLLYVDEVDSQFEDLFTQLLFSYKINPQTVLFVGYSDNRIGDQSIDLTQENRTFFVKFGYALVL